MAFIKTAAADSWRGLCHDEHRDHVKWASHGLRGHDLQTFLKQADHRFATFLKDFTPRPGEQLTHNCIVGAHETFGCNLNGDAFSEYVCRERHKTFEKYARVYRNHDNKPGSPSYGRVLHAVYNDAMHRIELLSALNGTEKAAALNGGFVADQECQALAQGKQLAWSMSCSVSHDVCSSCGNRARDRSEYCTEGLCKHGGLARHIGRLCADGHQLCAHNPDPTWFDNSIVDVPADPTALTIGQLMRKAASAEPRLSLLCDDAVTQSLEALALAERNYRPGYQDLAFAPQMRTSLEAPPLLTKAATAQFFECCARQGIVLPLSGLLKVSGVDDAHAESLAGRFLPGLYSTVLSNPAHRHLLTTNPYQTFAAPENRLRLWATKAAAEWSLLPARVEQRARTALVRGVAPRPAARLAKLASFDDGAYQIAQQYALYSAAMLDRLTAQHGETLRAPLADAMVRQSLMATPA